MLGEIANKSNLSDEAALELFLVDSFEFLTEFLLAVMLASLMAAMPSDMSDNEERRTPVLIDND